MARSKPVSKPASELVPGRLDGGSEKRLYPKLSPIKRKFLAAYEQIGLIGKASDIVGCSRWMHSYWHRTDENYRVQFEEAWVRVGALFEDEVSKRARGLDGSKPSDLLLMFIMKSRDARYRDTAASVTVTLKPDALELNLSMPKEIDVTSAADDNDDQEKQTPP